MSEKNKRPSICDNCNSKTYCSNKAAGVKACINYNRFPKDTSGEAHR